MHTLYIANGFGSTDSIIRQIHSPNIDCDNIILSTHPFGYGVRRYKHE